ncbi:MAG: MFS transporter [Pseudomonadota bacterium]
MPSHTRRRDFVGLLCANTILGAAFPIQLVVGGLAGLMIAPDPTLATLPSSIQTLAGMLAAAPFSTLMGRLGRKAGFSVGGLLTLFGALAAVQGLNANSFPLLCVAHFLMGAGWASFQYFRFAASEVVEEARRPIAISLMSSSLLIAALVGPQIFMFAKDLLAPVAFAGAYAATGLIAVVGLLPLTIVRFPLLARQSHDRHGKASKASLALSRSSVKIAIATAAVSQGVMVFLMVPTPIAMVSAGLSADMASDAIRWHIVAMFAPSFFTGFLIQRFGVKAIMITGLLIMIGAATFAATGIAAIHFYGSLIVLGIGWNFGFIGATSMLDAALLDSEKAKVQGINDTLIGFVSTVGAFSAGFFLSSFGWMSLALVSGALVALALIALLMLVRDTS